MLDDIYIFLKVVEFGTYVRTAKILKTTQSTISRRIQALEEHFGVPLIKRNYRGLLEVTNEGEQLYHKFYSLYKNANNLIKETVDQGKIKGTLKIALPLLISRSLISPFIPEFIEKYPDIKLILEFTNNPIDLVKDNFDVAISTVLPLSLDSKVKLLRKIYLKLYASPKYIDLHDAPTTLDELKNHQCIGIVNEYGEVVNNYKVYNVRENEETIYDYSAKLYVNHLFQAIEMARYGTFIVGAWDIMVENLLQNKTIVPVLSDYVFGESSLFLIRSGSVQSNLEQLFVKFIEQKLQIK